MAVPIVDNITEENDGGVTTPAVQIAAAVVDTGIKSSVEYFNWIGADDGVYYDDGPPVCDAMLQFPAPVNLNASVSSSTAPSPTVDSHMSPSRVFKLPPDQRHCSQHP